MSHTHRHRALLLLFVSCGALILSGTASAACTARPLVLMHAAGRSPVKLPAFLRATLICGDDRGPRGTTGEAGKNGRPGARGSIGLTGATGATGPTGAAGATGPSGPQGVAGTPGTAGAPGANGAPGTNGTTGTPGTPGAPGTPAPSDYAYIYTTGAQTIALETGITFNLNGPMTSSITHTLGASTATLSTAGTYKMTMSVWSTAAFKLALYLNGTIVNSAAYGTSGSNREVVGEAIVTVATGDVLEIRNHGSIGSFDLDSGASPVDASLLIQRLA